LTETVGAFLPYLVHYISIPIPLLVEDIDLCLAMLRPVEVG
jgi:hypothetical protein